jgi:predicted nucleic acid-binding protein
VKSKRPPGNFAGQEGGMTPLERRGRDPTLLSLISKSGGAALARPVNAVKGGVDMGAVDNLKAFLKARESGTEFTDPVVDTCVFIEMFDPDSPRHEIAKRLGDFLIDNKLKAYMPWTAMFEINRVIMNIRKNKPAHKLSKYFTEERMIVVERMPIDADFFSRYFIVNLPYTKAADMLFLSIAYVDKRPLVTEDTKLIKAARKAKVSVFTTSEYLDHVSR